MSPPRLESIVADLLRRAGVASGAEVLAVLADVDAWADRDAEAWTLLDEDETARARRQRDPRAGRRLAMAYALRRAVLGFCLGVPAGAVPMRRAGNGRPFLEGGGLWLSLSHSGSAMALAVSRRGAVGIDVEQVPRASVMLEIATRVASPTELHELASLADEARADALLSLWVRKEALLKAAGVGLAVEMNEFDAPVSATVSLPVQPPLQARSALLDAGPRLRAALALEHPGPEPAGVALLRLEANRATAS